MRLARVADSVPSPDVPAQERRNQEQMMVLARDLNTLYRREQRKTTELEEAVDELQETYAATVRMLAFVIEAKDPHTHAHLERSFKYAKMLARRVDAELANNKVIEYGFLLHDIGKVGIPERILSKAGPLTAEEWEVMKMHPVIGSRIIEPVGALAGAAAVIEGHHERFDGDGYPRGLKGEEIPLAARIFAIADSFDAMTSDRPYRKALALDEALAELQRCAGTQFDPECVREFVNLDWSAGTPHGEPPVVAFPVNP